MNDGIYHTTILVSDKPEGRKEGTADEHSDCISVRVTGCMCVGVCEKEQERFKCLIVLSILLFCYFIQDYVRTSCLSKLINVRVLL